MTWPWTRAGPLRTRQWATAASNAWRQARGSVPSTSAKWKLGKFESRCEMLPPGGLTSTGRESVSEPGGGHLPPAAGGIGGGAHGLEEVLFDGGAESEGKGAVAVVREEP